MVIMIMAALMGIVLGIAVGLLPWGQPTEEVLYTKNKSSNPDLD
jgi:hypothetical protein